MIMYCLVCGQVIPDGLIFFCCHECEMASAEYHNEMSKQADAAWDRRGLFAFSYSHLREYQPPWRYDRGIRVRRVTIPELVERWRKAEGEFPYSLIPPLYLSGQIVYVQDYIPTFEEARALEAKRREIAEREEAIKEAEREKLRRWAAEPKGAEQEESERRDAIVAEHDGRTTAKHVEN